MTLPEEQLIDTARGAFNVLTWPGDSGPALAIHGLASTNRLWTWLHQAAPWATLLAPDLPGRGATPVRDARPSSARNHADGLAALLDAIGVETVDVIGMSLGGFIAVELAARHPDRVRSVTLVDGGLPTPVMAQPEELAGMLRAKYREQPDWPDVTAYARHHADTETPLVNAADPRFVEMLAHELRDGTAGGPVLRDVDTEVQDAVSVLASERPIAALAQLEAPTRLLHAQWSTGEGSAPMYPPEHVAALEKRTSALIHTELVERVDHAALIMTDRGAERCAAVLAKALGR
ncbi:alpha/beta fold hydrolase [Nocardia sp. NPDC006044]|uniref:alpha/beta fold hydrolase n=1 Tax=Nocardia sp. NPDC006044 TaxID=3364306 RepID=UPI003685F86C